MKEFFFNIRVRLLRKILGDDIGHLLVCHKEAGENNQRIINQLKKEYNEYGTQRISGKGNVNLPTELQ